MWEGFSTEKYQTKLEVEQEARRREDMLSIKQCHENITGLPPSKDRYLQQLSRRNEQTYMTITNGRTVSSRFITNY